MNDISVNNKTPRPNYVNNTKDIDRQVICSINQKSEKAGQSKIYQTMNLQYFRPIWCLRKTS